MFRPWNFFKAFFKKQKKAGLEAKFKCGEQLPWKGIWFEISNIEKEKLELMPVGLTWKRAKQIKEVQHA